MMDVCYVDLETPLAARGPCSHSGGVDGDSLLNRLSLEEQLERQEKDADEAVGDGGDGGDGGIDSGSGGAMEEVGNEENAAPVIKLHSDVQVLRKHPDPDAWDPKHAYGFPLGGAGPFLCTQGNQVGVV